MTDVLTQGPAPSPEEKIPPIRISRLTDAYYISIAPAKMVNDSLYVKQLAVYLSGLREDETVVLMFDPDNYADAPWSRYMTFMGVIQSTKAEVIVRCDKMDFTNFSYFYLLGNKLDFFQTGGLFFRPLYSNSKDALSQQERVGVAYLLTLIKRAQERGILSDDQYEQIDAGGYTHVDYQAMLRLKRDGLAPDVILRD